MTTEPIKFYKAWLRNRNYIIKFISISAAAALTVKFFYTDSLAENRPKASYPDEGASFPVKNEKLVSVHMLSRHGARTPLNLISGLEQAEYKSELLDTFVKARYKLKDLDNVDLDHDLVSFYDQRNMDTKLKGGAGRGQLTVVGEEQMFNLGRRVRERYVNQLHFLSPNYDPNEFYCRSSHFKRTIRSAKSVLAGVYAKSPFDELETPFTINVQKLHEDIIFPNALACSYYADMHNFLESLDLYNHNKEYIENLAKLHKATGRKVNFTVFRDDLAARQIHNLPFPKNLEDLLEKADRYASMELSSTSKHNLRITCGRLLHMIKYNLEETVKKDQHNENTNYHKFRYYSAHDTTLNAVLSALDLINDDTERWPPFAADIIIELWKDTAKKQSGDYFVRVYYCDKLVNPPSCKDDSKCNLNEFIEILETHGIDKHGYDQLCNQKFQ